MNYFIEIFGWLGAILVLVAYFLISYNRVSSDSFSFQFLNIFGAFLLIIYTYSLDAYASVLVNSIWVLIGLKSIYPHIKSIVLKSSNSAKEATIESAHIAFDTAVSASEIVLDTTQSIVEAAIESKEVIQEKIVDVAVDSKSIIQDVLVENVIVENIIEKNKII